MEVLSRDEFRNAVFSRDNYKCVVCREKAQDAHHIMERRLFEDGGYYLDNGASLCAKCHLLAESTDLTCEEIRNKAGIKTIILPEHLYDEYTYDKWGNIILSNGQKLKGELFYDESVQKILNKKNFSKYIKYPRTYHLPWSESRTKDDKTLESIDHFVGKEVVVTEKMDGEQTSMYSDYIHARSIDGKSHPTQSYVRNLHSMIKHNIPEEWRVCGENLYAKHSIHYKNLRDFFHVFSIWNDKNICLSWEDTEDWAALLGLYTVPIKYWGIFDADKIHSNYRDREYSEGYVIRLADSFNYSQFKKSVAKFVRKNHITTSHNWKYEKIIKNEKN